MRGISLLKLLSQFVDRNVFDMSYKYIRPHVDYGHVIYHNQRGDVMDPMYDIRQLSLFLGAGKGVVARYNMGSSLETFFIILIMNFPHVPVQLYSNYTIGKPTSTSIMQLVGLRIILKDM